MILFKKKIPETKIGSQEQKGNSIKYDEPKILLVDVNGNVAKRLTEDGLNIQTGTFGQRYNVTENEECGFNGELPYLIEKDIVVVNLNRDDSFAIENPFNKIKLMEADRITYIAQPGQNYFDPCNLFAMNYREEFNKVVLNGGILLVFAYSPIQENYYPYRVERGTLSSKGNLLVNSYNWIPTNSGVEKSTLGKEVHFDEESYEASATILKGCEGEIKYFCTFNPPNYEKSIIFLRNKLNDVVGYIKIVENQEKYGLIIFLPQFKDLYKPISNLLKDFLPQIKPELLPEFVKNNWLGDDEYAFPIVKEFQKQREQIVNQYEIKLAIIDTEINETKAEYEFFTNILISQGFDDFLVENIYKVLEYIGYKDLVNVDEIVEGKRQEDLRILDNRRFTVIEVKGHSGNPTEDDCQALLKYISRNMKKEKRTDIHGILIINHQRVLPPLSRNNPAFTKEQIDDALRDGYTLVSTWELFKCIRLFQEGLLFFADLDKDLHTPGLFKAIPSTWIHIGIIEKQYKDKTIACIHLIVDVLNQNDEIIIEDGNSYFRQNITNIMINDRIVDIARRDEPVSILINRPVSKQANIYKRF